VDLGVLVLIAGVISILLGLQALGDGEALMSLQVLGLLVLGAFFSSLFVWVERRVEHPIVPLFLQSVLGKDAKSSGEVLLPLSITVSVTAALSGNIVGYLNRYKLLSLVGMAIAIIGLSCLAQMGQGTSQVALVRYVVLSGFGYAIAAPLYNLAVQNAAPLNVLGVATSMVYFMRSIFAALGVAVFGMILTSQTKASGLPHALSSIFYLVTGLAVASFIATIFLKELPLRKSNASPNAPSDALTDSSP
jgi:hypothetical protein